MLERVRSELRRKGLRPGNRTYDELDACTASILREHKARRRIPPPSFSPRMFEGPEPYPGFHEEAIRTLASLEARWRRENGLESQESHVSGYKNVEPISDAGGSAEMSVTNQQPPGGNGDAVETATQT
jgi:hypothetical protein